MYTYLNSSFKISLDPNQIIISQEKNGKEFLAVRVNKDGLFSQFCIDFPSQ